jgi:hypothetical protein
MDKKQAFFKALFELFSNKRAEFEGVTEAANEGFIEPVDIPFIPDAIEKMVEPMIAMGLEELSFATYDGLMVWLREKAGILSDVNYG